MVSKRPHLAPLSMRDLVDGDPVDARPRSMATPSMRDPVVGDPVVPAALGGNLAALAHAALSE